MDQRLFSVLAGPFDHRLPQAIAPYQRSSAGPSSSCPPPSNLPYGENQKPHHSDGDLIFANYAQQAPLYPLHDAGGVLSRHSSASPQSVDHHLVGPSSFMRMSTATRQRTLQACDKCRERKTKCSGERPVCQRCSQRGLICCYAPLKESKPRGPSSKTRPLDSVSIGDQLDGTSGHASSPSHSPHDGAGPIHTPRPASCDSSPQQRLEMLAPSGRLAGMAPLLPRRQLGHVSCASAPSLSSGSSRSASAHPDFDSSGQFRVGSFPTSMHPGLYDHHLQQQRQQQQYAAAATRRQQHMFESPPAVGYPDGNDLGSMALPLSAPASGFGTSSAAELLPHTATGQSEMNALFYMDDASGHASSAQSVDGVAEYMSPVGSNHSSMSSPTSGSPSIAPPSSAYSDYALQHAYAGPSDYNMQNQGMYDSAQGFSSNPAAFNSQMQADGGMHHAHGYVTDHQAAFVPQHSLQYQHRQGQEGNAQMQMNQPQVDSRYDGHNVMRSQVDGHPDGRSMSSGFYNPFA